MLIDDNVTSATTTRAIISNNTTYGIMLPLPFSSALCSDGDTVSSIRTPRWRKCSMLMLRFRICPTMLLKVRRAT